MARDSVCCVALGRGNTDPSGGRILFVIFEVPDHHGKCVSQVFLSFLGQSRHRCIVHFERQRFENVAQLQALPRQKRVLAPFVALDVASLYETQFFHFDERGVGGGFGEMRPVAQFALRQPVFLPEDAQENPLTERNIFRLQSKLKRPVEPAGRQSYQPGHALVGLDRYVA